MKARRCRVPLCPQLRMWSAVSWPGRYPEPRAGGSCEITSRALKEHRAQCKQEALTWKQGMFQRQMCGVLLVRSQKMDKVPALESI